ncbi:hypothetical protein ACP4OV_002354 [Aristida adscensionis]
MWTCGSRCRVTSSWISSAAWRPPPSSAAPPPASRGGAPSSAQRLLPPAAPRRLRSEPPRRLPLHQSRGQTETSATRVIACRAAPCRRRRRRQQELLRRRSGLFLPTARRRRRRHHRRRPRCVQQGAVVARRAPPPRGRNTVDDLCLWNTMAGGGCTFLPAAAFKVCRYILVTGHDLPTSDDATATRIVAVELEDRGRPFNLFSPRCLTYQLFSASGGGGGGGEWGPVKRSPELIYPCTGGRVICRGAVHWLGSLEARIQHDNCTVVAVDVRTGRTWMTVLPETLRRHTGMSLYTKMVLATSRDGHLSVVGSPLPPCHRIEAWVLAGGDAGERWTLRWTVDMQDLPGYCPSYRSPAVYRFCPRSGYVMGNVERVRERGRRLLMDVDSGTAREMNMCTRHGPNWPYEMDLSTYISKMKHF